jgi:ABC-2 type transport system permease protein
VRNALLIARRELRSRVRRTGYRITTVGGLLLIVALFLLPTITHAIDDATRTEVAVAGADPATVAALQRALPERAPNGKPTLELRRVASAAAAERLRRDGEVDGALLLGRVARYDAKEPGDEVARLRSALSSVAAAQRLRRRGLDGAQIAAAFAAPRLAVHDTDGKTVSSQSRSLVYALLLMLYMSILVYGAAVSSAIVQEKASRVTEVMMARVTPLAHMAGKLGGVGLAGLLQFALWIVAALAILAAGDVLGSSAGIRLADVPAGTFVAFGVFFVLGFAFYGTLYAGLSAPASRIEDATGAGAIPGVLIVASFLASTVVLGNPESSLARVLSFVPPLSPMTMFTRVALGSPPWWEVLVSALALLAAIGLVLVLAARVYRVSILSYGTRQGLGQIARMMLRPS